MGKKHLRILTKRIIIIVSTIMLGLWLTEFIISTGNAVVELRFEDDLINSVKEVVEQDEQFKQGDSLYEEYLKEITRDIVGLESFYYEENGFSLEMRDVIYHLNNNYGFHYYYKGGIDKETGELKGIMYNDPDLVCDLNDEELKELFKTGFITKENGEIHYTCAPVGNDGYTFLRWMAETIMYRATISSVVGTGAENQKVIRINPNTETIQDSNYFELIGKNINEIDALEDIKECGDEGSWVILNGGKIAYMYSEIEESGDIICSYMDISNILYAYLRSCIIPLVLGWITLIFIMNYVLKFNKYHTQEEKAEIAYLHVYKDYYTDGRLVYHTIALGVFAAIVVSLATIYIHALVNYSTNSVKSASNLNIIKNITDISQETNEALLKDFDTMQKICIKGIADYYLMYPDQIENPDSIKNINDKLNGVSNITVYDITGTIEYDTQNHIGYTISRDPDVPEYALWDLIDGQADLVHYYDNVEYYAGRRQDKDGIIRISVNNDIVSDFVFDRSNERIVAGVKVDSDIKGYVPAEDNDIVYYSTGKGMIEEDNRLSKDILDGARSKIDLIGDKHYLIDSKVSNYGVYFVGKEIGRIYGKDSLVMIGGIIAFFVAQQIIILALSVRRKKESPQKIISLRESLFEAQEFNEKMMDERFRKSIRNIFVIACVMVVLLLLVDLKLANVPILKFLFGSKWEKGFNLFSFTMLLNIAVGGLIVSKIVQSIIILFTTNMGPRGLTIGRMTSSLVKFIFLIAIMILMLMNIGINLSTLLTGAGIVGAMLSFCAQQTVNDMLSGFLIVFENLFNIGDYIAIDDYRGQVCEIGIRTTKLRMGDEYKIFNNSEIRKIHLMGEAGRGAICLVDVAYKEDINKVIELVKNNAERYRKEIPEITNGPNIDGVMELGDSGVKIRIWAHTDVANVLGVERAMRRVTKDIFDENGIEIPFNQVTIHTADN